MLLLLFQLTLLTVITTVTTTMTTTHAEAGATVITLCLTHIVLNQTKSKVTNFENVLEFHLNKRADNVVIIEKLIKVSLLNNNKIIMFDAIVNRRNTKHKKSKISNEQTESVF